MIQEYLLKDIADKDEIKAYEPINVQRSLFSADDENCWYVQFSCNGENEDTARQLSKVDEYIQEKFQVTVLEDGCSAYFNKRLYPLVSGFEYKLRKLLYLMSAINRGEKSASNISDLETKDFGQIFVLLFIDSNFMAKSKDLVKNRNREFFSKTDVIAAIESIEENAVWDTLIGKDVVPTLRNRFNDIREYRNDVMHSHHLSWSRYKEISSLYKVIHDELDMALHNIEVVESVTPSKPTFNQTLESALKMEEQLSELMDELVPKMEVINQGIERIAQNTELLETLERMRAVTTYTFTPEQQRVLEQLAQLFKIAQLSSD